MNIFLRGMGFILSKSYGLLCRYKNTLITSNLGGVRE